MSEPGAPERQLPYSVRFEWGLAAAGRRNFAPEAQSAAAAFDAAEPRLAAVLRGCSSGRELVDRGFSDDVVIAAELDGSSVVAVLRDGAFQAG